MCGRFSLVEVDDLEMRYRWPLEFTYKTPKYNVAPGQFVPILTAHGWQRAHFGLVPIWAKDMNTGYTMINARAETIMEKPTYKSAVLLRRCLIPASGFFEWDHSKDTKTPFYFTVKDMEIFSFAGIYATKPDAEGKDLVSFSIITTKPNSLVAPYHDRMPVILDKDEEKTWLDQSLDDPAAILPLLDAYPAADMAVHQVGKEVGNSRNDYPELIAPVSTESSK